MVVANRTILVELEAFLSDADFFTLYPTRKPLKRYLENSVSDSDKIRAILRDEYVQRDLFPDWQALQDPLVDPVEYYKSHRRI